jgi:LysM repeat protein
MKKFWLPLLLIAALGVLILPAYASQPASAPVYYRVRWGDTLTSIAWRYCTSPWAIARWNGIPDPNKIYAGQILVIYPGCYYPPQPPCVTVHYVSYGETLLSIARMYGVSVWEIARLNGIFNLNLIYVGQRLLIPCWN